MDIASKLKSQQEVLDGVKAELESRGEKPEFSIESLPVFNRKIWGLRKGMTVIGARTSQAKTALSLQLAFDLACQQVPTMVLSLEQDEQEIMERIFCNAQNVNNYDLLTGGFNKDMEIRSKWEKFCQYFKTIPLQLTCGIGKTFEEVNFLIENLEPLPRVVVVDYVQNISLQYQKHREVMNDYIIKFRSIMKQNGICGILCSQINRTALDHKDNEPKLHQLKETGCLEETADMVILNHWDYKHTYDEATKNEFKLIVAKNRNGRTGEHMLRYLPEFYKFEEIEKTIVPTTDIEKEAISVFGGELKTEAV